MSRVFRITPKRIKRSNGTVLTPDMVITVTTRQHTTEEYGTNDGTLGGRIEASRFLPRSDNREIST